MIKKVLILTSLFLLSTQLTVHDLANSSQILPFQVNLQLQKNLRLQVMPLIRFAGNTQLHTPELVKKYYMSNDYFSVWFTKQGVREHAGQLVTILGQAEKDGLNPRDYHLKKINKMLGQIKQRKSYAFNDYDTATLELLLTDAFFLYARHLAFGQVVQPSEYDVLYGNACDQQLMDLLKVAMSIDALRESLTYLRPKHQGYLKLRKTLAYYHKHAGLLDKLQIVNTPPLKPGDCDNRRIPILREKLRLFGDLKQTADERNVLFNQEVEQAIRHFQSRHGLAVTGALDGKTLKLLNRPAAEIIQTLEINMERWRRQSTVLEKKYIRVNIPAFMLQVIEYKQPVMQMKVVVGRKTRQTPVLNYKIEYITLNPYWVIPPNIVLQDKISKIRHDPDFFTKYRIEVLEFRDRSWHLIDPATVDWKTVAVQEFRTTYRFQQIPCTKNALGRIKFGTPNPHNVYMHDTPRQKLFNRRVRCFSSGCIRLEKPLDLAKYALRDHQFWTQTRLKAALSNYICQVIKLKKEIPVYIQYFTAEVDTKGIVRFYDDIYHHDDGLLKAMRNYRD